MTKFLGGEWAKRASAFVFCTSYDTREKKIADELLLQAERLQSSQIVLQVWHPESLSARLKELPIW